MKEKTTQERVDDAIKKIERLRDYRNKIASGKLGKQVESLPKERVQQMVDLLDEIEKQSSRVIQRARSASRKIERQERKLATRAESGKKSSGLGTLIGKMGSAVVKSAGAVIDKAAVPITKSVVNTAANLTETTARSALGVANSITKAAANTATGMIGAAQNTSSSLINQTANLASSLTRTATDSMNSILGNCGGAATSAVKSALGFGADVTNVAAAATNRILNPSSGNGLKSLVSGTAQTASQMVGSVTKMASDMLTSTSGITSNLLSSAASAVGNLGQSAGSVASGMLGSIGNMASGIAGSLGSSIANTVASGLGSVGSLVGDIGGAAGGIAGGAASIAGSLFGAASSVAQSAAAAGGSALSAASSMVGGLAQGVGSLSSDIVGGMSSAAQSLLGGAGDAAGGLASLAGSLLGSAADVAGSMASAGADAVSSMIGAASDAGSSMLGAASDVAGSLLSTAADVGGSLMDTVGDVAGGLLDAAGGIAEGAGDLVGGLADFAGDAIGSVADLAGDVLDSAADLASDVIDTAADLAGDALDLAGDLAEGVMDAAADVVDGLMDSVFGDAEDIEDEIEDDFDDMEEDADEMEDEYDEEDWGEEDEENEEDYEDEEDWEDDDYWDDDDEDDEETPTQDDDYDDEEFDEDFNPEWGDEPNPDSDSSTTTPISASTPPADRGLSAKTDVDKPMGWKTITAEIPKGIIGMMHDGDQQLLNPYGYPSGAWTMYSFRPKDRQETWPQIAITPSSFEAISSMDDMLNNIPFVVVKEYFFKNTASTMLSFVKKIMGAAKQATMGSGTGDEQGSSNQDEGSSQGTGDAKSTGKTLLDKVKDIFHNITLKEAAIEIPYLLYCGLRQKVYGNTYIFPYIVQSGSTVINQASNNSEWVNGEGGGGLMDTLKGLIQSAANLVGGVAASVTGSQAKFANLFPAPTWNGPGSDKVSFAFDLVLINDHIIKSRNNYMCVNTIINNNRSIQKAILAFPGALYEVWLPTGQRHLMCTGDFKLYPLGLNRQTPPGFFNGGEAAGAQFRIGVDMGNAAPMKNYHQDELEVIPDAYKLSISFTSCLANNLNTSVFQYYVKMAGYDDYAKDKMGGTTNKDSMFDSVAQRMSGMSEMSEEDTSAVEAPSVADKALGDSQKSVDEQQTREVNLAKTFQRAISDLVEETSELPEAEEVESDEVNYSNTFNEDTYIKRLQKIKTQVGERAVNADSVVVTIRKAQKAIRESNRFLSKLYNAPNNNLWYRPIETEELYTTIEPDYRQVLRKQYGEKLQQIRELQNEIQSEKASMKSITEELQKTSDLDEREPLLQKKVDSIIKINDLMDKRDEASDDALKIDVNLLQAAYDEHDRAVSVKKNVMTFNIFKQVWNEKIMNSYERDKLQYLTSEEKTRYFNEKIRELKKYDTYGILNHPDWFFRVTVIDFITSEMQRLVYWFKNCAYDDFDTIYRIVRKLGLLQLDIDSARSSGEFNINKTNLFFISKEDAKNYKKIDDMLEGNTLYELFMSQLNLNFVKYENEQDDSIASETTAKDKELVYEQDSEIQLQKQRTVRQDVVKRFWGGEAELTRTAYAIANKNVDRIVGSVSWTEMDGSTSTWGEDGKTTLRDLKNEILKLKVAGDTGLKMYTLLGAFTNSINAIKEKLVIDKMNEMKEAAQDMIDIEDASASAKAAK